MHHLPALQMENKLKLEVMKILVKLHSVQLLTIAEYSSCPADDIHSTTEDFQRRS